MGCRTNICYGNNPGSCLVGAWIRAIARWAKPRTCSIQAGLQPVLRYRMAHPSLDGGVLPEQVERHAPQQAQVARAWPGARGHNGDSRTSTRNLDPDRPSRNTILRLPTIPPRRT